MSLLTHFAQGTQEWFDVRVGRLTSSCIVDAVTKRKRRSTKDSSPTEPLAAYLNLRMDLAVERVTKKPIDHFVSRWMQEGKDKEPLARVAYELSKDVETAEIGFATHPEIDWAGASPDGLVGDDGLVEFKCPKANTHGEYLVLECIPDQYIPQMVWQMACTGRQWCDFVSFHQDFPEPLNLIVHRLLRNEQQIAVMEAEAAVFLKETAELTMRLTHGLEGMLRESLANSVLPKARIPNDPIPFEGGHSGA